MMTGPSDIRATYALALRSHAHELIAMAYHRMESSSYVDWEEPAITGELVRVMRELLESNDAPVWAVYYSISDDPPLNADGKLGKFRPRVDIEFERTGIRGQRPRLRFEAKRLGTSSKHKVGAYLGTDGMGCFLSGKYPLNHNEAGMLAYIQSGSEKDWSKQIESALSVNAEKYCAVPPPYHHQKISALKHTYASHHNLTPQDYKIVIHHVLLRFR
jgi:hypothetical protein